ncbi:MAG TPA: hypothetical protein VGI95_11490 [Caulobacteraceae bacterium]|jgi:hypothetical protein
MILGLSVELFTKLHVAISLIGLISGLVAVMAMVGKRYTPGVTALFLATTVLTSVTGFFFHSKAFGPPHVIGVLSLVIVAVALFAIYVRKLAGIWRGTYVVTAVLALYLNAFVAVVQAFQKLPVLHAMAPRGSEPPFAIAQAATLALMALLGFLAFRNFKPATAAKV